MNNETQETKLFEIRDSIREQIEYERAYGEGDDRTDGVIDGLIWALSLVRKALAPEPAVPIFEKEQRIHDADFPKRKGTVKAIREEMNGHSYAIRWDADSVFFPLTWRKAATIKPLHEKAKA